MPLSTGTRLGPYEIQSAIGAGGMGEVCRARDTRLDRTVAVKILPSDVAGDPDLRLRFGREARAVAALDHPNISRQPTSSDSLGGSSETLAVVVQAFRPAVIAS